MYIIYIHIFIIVYSSIYIHLFIYTPTDLVLVTIISYMHDFESLLHSLSASPLTADNLSSNQEPVLFF